MKSNRKHLSNYLSLKIGCSQAEAGEIIKHIEDYIFSSLVENGCFHLKGFISINVKEQKKRYRYSLKEGKVVKEPKKKAVKISLSSKIEGFLNKKEK